MVLALLLINVYLGVPGFIDVCAGMATMDPTAEFQTRHGSPTTSQFFSLNALARIQKLTRNKRKCKS
jgi:hypothetical protein